MSPSPIQFVARLSFDPESGPKVEHWFVRDNQAVVPNGMEAALFNLEFDARKLDFAAALAAMEKQSVEASNANANGNGKPGPALMAGGEEKREEVAP